MARYFRIGKRQYMDDPLDGIGASLMGNRWNSKGVRMAYTSGSRALCCLELLVHVSASTVPDELVLAEVEVPEDLIIRSKYAPGGSVSQRQHGDVWVKRARSAAMLVPSVIIPEEMNLLINPEHPDAGKIQLIEVKPYSFDARLLK